jgi:hypothetical protein
MILVTTIIMEIPSKPFNDTPPEWTLMNRMEVTIRANSYVFFLILYETNSHVILDLNEYIKAIVTSVH